MLNRLEKISTQPAVAAPPRTMAIASGKGGVGKSVIAYNLASALARKASVLLIDADFQLGNLHLLANIAPDFGLIDVCRTDRTIHETICKVSANLDLLSATGMESVGILPDIQKLMMFLADIRQLQEKYAFIIFDTASGILPHTNAILNAVDRTVLVTTPELTALSDTYALYKILTANSKQVNIGLLVNKEDRSDEIAYIYQKFCALTNQFLGHIPSFFGSLGAGQEMVDSVARQQNILEFAPESQLAGQFSGLAASLADSSKDKRNSRKPLSFTPVGADIKE